MLQKFESYQLSVQLYRGCQGVKAPSYDSILWTGKLSSFIE